MHLMLIQFKNKNDVPSCFGLMVILHLHVDTSQDQKLCSSCFGLMAILHPMLIQFKNKNMSILVWSHGDLASHVDTDQG